MKTAILRIMFAEVFQHLEDAEPKNTVSKLDAADALIRASYVLGRIAEVIDKSKGVSSETWDEWNRATVAFNDLVKSNDLTFRINHITGDGR